MASPLGGLPELPVTKIPPWAGWFTIVHNIVQALSTSGTTAQRPTTGLWVGRRYFDTTLGIPIWVQSLGPTVWVNATGAPV